MKWPRVWMSKETSQLVEVNPVAWEIDMPESALASTYSLKYKLVNYTPAGLGVHNGEITIIMPYDIEKHFIDLGELE